MKSVYFVTQFFPPVDAERQTGGIISNRNFLRCVARDYDVTVLSFDYDADSTKFADEPYRVVCRPAPRWRAPGLLLNWQEFVRQNTQTLLGTAEHPDFLVATTSTLSAFDAAPTQTKCVAVVQAFENFGFRCPWVPLQTRVKLMKGALLRRFADVRQMRHADGVLTNSTFMSAAITSRFVIPSERIHVLRQQIGFSPAIQNPPQNTVGFVHRGPDKNIAHVVDLARNAPDLTFLVYGHESELPVDIPDNMSVVGWTSDRASMFASARLWLVPSLWAEPFGRVSIEAQAAGRAVLVANRGGLSETVVDPRYLIDGFETDAWLNRIRILLSLDDTELAKASDKIKKTFSAEAHDESIRSAIETIKKTQTGPKNDI